LTQALIRASGSGCFWPTRAEAFLPTEARLDVRTLQIPARLQTLLEGADWRNGLSRALTVLQRFNVLPVG
jgi:hypothetical protein